MKDKKIHTGYDELDVRRVVGRLNSVLKSPVTCHDVSRDILTLDTAR